MGYRMTSGTHLMSSTLDVNGAAQVASDCESAMPACAAFSAPQSFPIKCTDMCGEL